MEGNNLKAVNLEHDLKQKIASADMPIGTVYYIVKTILAEIQDLFQQQVNKEAQEAEAAAKNAETPVEEVSEQAQPQEEAAPLHMDGEVITPPAAETN